MKLVVALVLFCSLGSAAGAREFVCAGFEAVPVQTGGAAAKTVVRKAPILSQKVVHLLVIFAQFSDEKPGDDSVPEYAADLFDPTLPGSFSHFYNTMSFGQFPVTGTVLPRRYRSARPASYDLDGDLDLVTTTLSTRLGGDELYQNRNGFLVPVGGLVGMEPKSNGRGLSAADYDLDGDLDLLIADGARTRLYRNITPHQGHWLQVELEGTEHNRHALGARVELKSGAQRHVREIQLVYGYCSQASPRLHFGLGDVAQVDTLRVLWPGGQEGILLNLSADQLLSLGAGDLITAVLEERAVLPEVFALQPNYPNPFNAQTMLSYQLPQKTPVELTIYNVAGQRVKRLVRAVQEAGYYQVSWKGRDEKGRPVGSGVYLYRLRAGSFAQTRRLVVLK